MPPVPKEDFEETARQYGQNSASGATLGGRKKTAAVEEQSLYCKDCRKPFHSKNAYENHLKSKRHLENVDGSMELVENGIYNYYLELG